MSIAKDFNDLSAILPDELNGKLLECPCTLIIAIEHAKMILSWYENVPDEKRPPKSIWLNPVKLHKWFKDVFGDKKNKKDYDHYVEVDQ